MAPVGPVRSRNHDRRIRFASCCGAPEQRLLALLIGVAEAVRRVVEQVFSGSDDDRLLEVLELLVLDGLQRRCLGGTGLGCRDEAELLHLLDHRIAAGYHRLDVASYVVQAGIADRHHHRRRLGDRQFVQLFSEELLSRRLDPVRVVAEEL